MGVELGTRPSTSLSHVMEAGHHHWGNGGVSSHCLLDLLEWNGGLRMGSDEHWEKAKARYGKPQVTTTREKCAF